MLSRPDIFWKEAFSLKEGPREGHLKGLDSDVLEAAVNAKPTVAIKELSEHVNDSQLPAHHEMRKIVCCCKMGSAWPVSRTSQTTCRLLRVISKRLFGDRVFTRGEKWTLYFSEEKNGVYYKNFNLLETCDPPPPDQKKIIKRVHYPERCQILGRWNHEGPLKCVFSGQSHYGRW